MTDWTPERSKDEGRHLLALAIHTKAFCAPGETAPPGNHRHDGAAFQPAVGSSQAAAEALHADAAVVQVQQRHDAGGHLGRVQVWGSSGVGFIRVHGLEPTSQ